jgi:hypothetical protein
VQQNITVELIHRHSGNPAQGLRRSRSCR